MVWRKKTTEEFIVDAKKVHGDKYDYSKVNYVDSHTKVCIICPEHGEFYQIPTNHLSGKGCKKCAQKESSKKRLKNIKQFIKDAKRIHGDKYDYSKVEYKGCETKVCIICPEHGEFWQTPSNHTHGRGCKECSKKIQQKPNLERTEKARARFVEKAKLIHGDKYDYSKVEYVNSKTRVCVVCPEHGEFWIRPDNHLSGRGCYLCNESHLEKYVAKILCENNIEYERQKTFDWLKRKNGVQKLDFFIPLLNIAIECQGEQHYKPVDFAGNGEEWAKKLFEQNIKRDKIKLCKVLKHNIKMIYVNEENKNNFLNEIL